MAKYNKYQLMPYIPYRIIEYVANNNENIWKILKYNTYDCLSEDDLTYDEKMALIWSHAENQSDYRIFFAELVEDMIPESETMIKIYKGMTKPLSTVNAIALYEFDILYGGKIALIDYNGIPCGRGDVVEAELLNTLNGVNVGGVGNIQFNTKMSSMSRSELNIGNNKNFTGTSLVMVVDISDVSDDEC